MISVIIPVYNTEKYISRCINSVQKQTYSDLEIIIIDDGSTDSSGKIIDEISKGDSRIITIHTRNCGQSAARNHGLDKARGEIIAFVDSDDFLPDNAYEIMLACMEKYNADIVCGGINEVDEDGALLISAGSSNEVYVYNKEETFNELCVQDRFRFQVWNKLIRQKVIGINRFPEGQKYEEIIFDQSIIRNCTCSAYVDAPIYNYVVSRPGNTKSSFSNQKLKVFNDIDGLIAEADKNNNLFAKRKLIGMRLNFSVTLGIAARKSNADADIIEFLDNEFSKSRELCREYNCGNRNLYILYSISPWLVSVYRKIHRTLIDIRNRAIIKKK